ncbi:MAG: class I SAM-dependent methyltransferase [Bacteroidia bacterium]|jgi:SAM-dependent methyltransferase
MDNFNKHNHWENIYNTKQLTEVSWYQPTPNTSLKFITDKNLNPTSNIIDVGGGDSFFVDHLLTLGFTNISVLDISETAIERAKKRLGEKAKLVNWIVCDILNFKPTQRYDFWHDRAAFHFLTEQNDINKYITILNQSLIIKGFALIGTFSENGPKKCSGIDIKQYSHCELKNTFNDNFEVIENLNTDHQTPFNTIQNFNFCLFKKQTN